MMLLSMSRPLGALDARRRCWCWMLLLTEPLGSSGILITRIIPIILVIFLIIILIILSEIRNIVIIIVIIAIIVRIAVVRRMMTEINCIVILIITI